MTPVHTEQIDVMKRCLDMVVSIEFRDAEGSRSDSQRIQTR